MSIIKDNFIFIHIPKTAGTSIEQIIGGSGHKTAAQILNSKVDDFGNKLEKELPIICFVRNPYDRLVSAYHFVKQSGYADMPENFADVVNNLDHWMSSTIEHFRPQVDFVKKDGEIIADTVYKFENLQADFNKMKLRFGFSGDLPHVQTSKHQHYTTYYTPILIERVRQAYSEDLNAFGYNFKNS